MRNVIPQKVVIGGLIWIAVIAISWISLRNSFQDSPDSLRQLTAFVTLQRKTVELKFDGYVHLVKGDPVFLADSDDMAPVGMVSSVPRYDDKEGVTTVQMFAASPILCEDDFLEYHSSEDSMEWLVRTMFHQRKREEIRSLIQSAYAQHRDEIMSEFRPVIEDTLNEASELLKDDLKRAFQGRQAELAKIGNRYQNELIKKELIPLFQKEIWPIVQREGEPLVQDIGREIWNEVSVFSFGWRYLYDKSPLPEKKLTEKKFREFVDQKAMPIIKSHTDDFLELQKRVGRQVSENEEVKQAISKSLSKVMSDEEIRKLLVEVFKEVTLDNQRLMETLKTQMASAKAQRALALANAKLDPTIREIGVALFGHPSDGITPEFARVLRRRILHKDARWLTLHLRNPDHNVTLNRNQPFPKSIQLIRSSENTNRPLPGSKNRPREASALKK